MLLGRTRGSADVVAPASARPGGGARTRLDARTRAFAPAATGRYRVDVEGRTFEIDGTVRARGEDGVLAVVAHVALERYVEGTVGREMPASWEPEALRAQAIVSRTFALRALREPADPDWDLEATTASQVFGGAAGVTDSVREAVRATRGEYLAFDGAPILAYFHSASGGRTAASEEVWGRPVAYLPSVAVPDEDEAPSTYWRAAVARTTLRRALEGLGLDVGRIEGVRVAERWPSGRVKRVVVRGEGGERNLSGPLWREALGPNVVKSTLFELRDRGDDIVLVGSGHGHGVGMSQWGAKGMAARGASHREILATFYPGATLEAARADSREPAGAHASLPPVASGGER
ncbi:MAG: SpoIID/LytB domain-containing protein [Myxococcota bacterium]